MERRSGCKRVARILPLLLILLASIQLVLLSLDQLSAPGRPFNAEASVGQDAWKYKSKLEAGCFCCSGAALIPQRTTDLEEYAALKGNTSFRSRDLAHHLLSSLKHTQTSLAHSSALPNHLTVGSHVYPLHPHSNLPDLPPVSRKVWFEGKRCSVVSYSKNIDATPTHGENVWGMITSDQGWDVEVQGEKEAMLIVAMMGGKGGGMKNWGLGAGLMEWYAKGGGPNSSPLERPLVFLFAEDEKGLEVFLDLYRSEAVLNQQTSDPYHELTGLRPRPKIMASLVIEIPTLEEQEHYGPLTLRTSPSTDLKDQESHLLGLISYLVSIRSPVTPFEVDNNSSSSSSSILNFVKSWSPLLSDRLEILLQLRLSLSPSFRSSLSSILNRHQIPSLTLHLPRRLTTAESPFSHSVYSISTLSQVLDSTIQALSKSDPLPNERRVPIGRSMWIAGEGLGLGVALLGVMLKKRERSTRGWERWSSLVAAGLGATGGWRAMGRASPFPFSPLLYAVGIITLTSGLILAPYVLSFDRRRLLPWLHFLLALAVPLIVYLPPTRRMLVVTSFLPFLVLSSSLLTM
ncbi:hypothetical protein BDY24DRAFT_382138 [Mrakia frigida]|uniref:uncharacterized protein n=1 Tax=Mrakia frigida TaxID=29902 RepID=UPI003FCC0A11